MRKSYKKYLSFSLALAMCMSLAIPSFAIDIKENNGFQIDLVPNGTNSISDANIANSESIPMELDIQLSSYDYNHESVVDNEVFVTWDDAHNWDTTLTGTAVVYNPDNAPIIVGSAHGYNNNNMSIENLIGLNYTYNVENGHCIATVTYGYSEETPFGTRVTFGKNNGEFDEALFAVNDKSRNDARLDTEADTEAETLPLQPRAIDRTFVYIGDENNHNGAVQLKAWAYAEFSPDGHNDIAASLKGNEAAAERIIVNNVDSTATYTAARNCEIIYSCSSNARYSNAEYYPKEKETSIPISIPIPKTFQSYRIHILLSGISVDATDRQTAWHMKNSSINSPYGITELFESGSEGVGAFNMLYYDNPIAAGDTDRVTVQVNGVIGYDYMFVDPEVGGFNNSTWYAYATASNTVICNNT